MWSKKIVDINLFLVEKKFQTNKGLVEKNYFGGNIFFGGNFFLVEIFFLVETFLFGGNIFFRVDIFFHVMSTLYCNVKQPVM